MIGVDLDSVLAYGSYLMMKRFDLGQREKGHRAGGVYPSVIKDLIGHPLPSACE